MNVINNLLDTRYKSGDMKFEGNSAIYIYGAGNVGKELVKVLHEKGFRITGIIDQRGPTLDPIDGVEVIDLLELRRRNGNGVHSASCLMSIFNPYIDCEKIESELRNHFQKVFSFPKVLWTFHKELGDRYWLTLPEFYADHATKLEEVYLMLADERSKQLFLSNLEFRLRGEYELLGPPDLNNQYFPKDLPRWVEPIRLLDCGAYDGDTLRQVCGTDYPIEAFAAFEPDLSNFSKLVATANDFNRLRPECRERINIPCGVSNATKTLSFASGLGTGSQLSSDGDVTIQCVAIDEVLPDFSPNLIKMDIEGAELDALHGCRRTIEQIGRAHV